MPTSGGTNPISTFAPTNYNTQTGTAYPLTIDGNWSVAQRIVDNFAPRAQSSPNMTIALDPGHIFGGSILTELASQSSGTFTAPVSLPRIDRVVIDNSSGIVSTITGTAAVSPVAPAFPAGKSPIARVLLQPTTIAITNSMITDERDFTALNSGSSGGGGGGGTTTGGGYVTSVQTFGAKGDGTTNDATAIQAALNAAQTAGGGIVYVPPTGHPYLINTGLSIPNGVCLMGAATRNFEGLTATVAQWASFGSWILSADMTNPAITLSGHGSSLDGINIIFNQVVPGAGTYVPTAFPYAISLTGSLCMVQNFYIMGAYQGIKIDYTTGSGGGTGTVIRHGMISAVRVGMQINNTNDSIMFDDLQFENQWFPLVTSIVNYMNTTGVGIECHYCDNCYFTNIQLYQYADAITFVDGTCQGVTHSAWHCMMSNIQINLSPTPISVFNGSTHVSVTMTNSIISSFPVTNGATNTAVVLSSDNVDFSITNTYIITGGAVVGLGNGGTGDGATGISGANLLINNCRIFYGNASPGPFQVINIAASSNAYFSNTPIYLGAHASVTQKTGSGTLHSASYTTS